MIFVSFESHVRLPVSDQ